MERYLTILRDRDTKTLRFRWASDNLARILCSRAIGKLEHKIVDIETPVGPTQGAFLDLKLMGVPIYRAGQSMVQAFLGVVPEAAVGPLLIQRDEKTAEPELFYKKFPPELPSHAVILDPMLATGGSAVMAVRILIENGYTPETISFVGVVAAPEGYDRLRRHLPESNITVAKIDSNLNEMKYIVPGLGDYGDRYFGT